MKEDLPTIAQAESVALADHELPDSTDRGVPQLVAGRDSRPTRADAGGVQRRDGETTTTDLIPIQVGDGLLCLLVRAHLYECEPSRPSGVHVAHHLHRFHGACARKQVLEFRVPGFERKVPHNQLATHELTPLSRTPHRRRLGGARSSTATMYPWTGFRPVARQNARRSETGKACYVLQAAQHAARSN